MQPLPHPLRTALALAGLVLLALGLTPLLGLGWVGFLAGACILFVAAWILWMWLRDAVEQPHRDFLAVVRDLRRTLPTGEAGQVLRTPRAADSFGLLAGELNDLVEETQAVVSTQLARARELEQTQTLFASMLGNMVEGVSVIDAAGRILFFNATARRIFDVRARDVIGRRLWEIAREPGMQAVIDAVLADAATVRQEVEFKRTRTVVEITAACLQVDGASGAVLVFHDVTDLRRLERMRREFVSNVSHELKTPLTSIQAYADTLLEGALDDPDHARLFLTRIVEQSDRLQNLIQDMLQLARIESQSEAFQFQPVNVARVLEECVDSRQAVARSREIQLSLEPGDRTIEVWADVGGFQTAVENLVANALNYTPEGGHVTVRWSGDESDVLVEVLDDGIGIPAEHRDRIFERFYRVDKARTRGKGGGTGLGLAIVKHVMTVFRGDVELDSEPGRGSTFRLRLPRHQPAVEPASPLRSEA